MSGASQKIEEAGFLPKAGGITVWNGRIHQLNFSSFGYDRPALHVERDEFDHLLLKHSASQGTNVQEEVNVTGVAFSGNELEVCCWRRPNRLGFLEAILLMA